MAKLHKAGLNTHSVHRAASLQSTPRPRCSRPGGYNTPGGMTMFWPLLLLPLLAAGQSGEAPDHQSDCSQRHQPAPVQHCLLQGQQRLTYSSCFWRITMITLQVRGCCAQDGGAAGAGRGARRWCAAVWTESGQSYHTEPSTRYVPQSSHAWPFSKV